MNDFTLFFFSLLHLRIAKLSKTLTMIIIMMIIMIIFMIMILSSERKYKDFVEIRTALEDGEIDGALLDTYVAAEHKDEIFSEKIYVKDILDRPFGYGVVLSGAARNVEQRCRDYVQMQISEIFHIIQNSTKTLDVSFFIKYCGIRTSKTLLKEYMCRDIWCHSVMPYTWETPSSRRTLGVKNPILVRPQRGLSGY